MLHKLNAAELKRPTMNAHLGLWNEEGVHGQVLLKEPVVMCERIVGIEGEKEVLSMCTQWCEVSFGVCIARKIMSMQKLCSGGVCEKKCAFIYRLVKVFGDRARLWVFEDNRRTESIRTKDINQKITEHNFTIVVTVNFQD